VSCDVSSHEEKDVKVVEGVKVVEEEEEEEEEE